LTARAKTATRPARKPAKATRKAGDDARESSISSADVPLSKAKTAKRGSKAPARASALDVDVDVESTEDEVDGFGLDVSTSAKGKGKGKGKAKAKTKQAAPPKVPTRAMSALSVSEDGSAMSVDEDGLSVEERFREMVKGDAELYFRVLMYEVSGRVMVREFVVVRASRLTR
jgi:hypothetical protein